MRIYPKKHFKTICELPNNESESKSEKMLRESQREKKKRVLFSGRRLLIKTTCYLQSKISQRRFAPERQQNRKLKRPIALKSESKVANLKTTRRFSLPTTAKTASRVKKERTYS